MLGRYGPYRRLETDVTLAHEIRDLYVVEGCWTAPRHHVWAESECFNTLPQGGPERERAVFPMNLLTWKSATPRNAPEPGRSRRRPLRAMRRRL